MKTPRQDLDATRGDTWSYPLDLTFTAGDLTGCKVWMTIKDDLARPDVQAALQLTSEPGGGIVVLTPTRVQITITKAQMATLRPRTYVYDVQVDMPSGESDSALTGFFDVEGDVTNSTTA